MLKWKKVGALTEDGQKYSDYMSDMQVISILTTLTILLYNYINNCFSFWLLRAKKPRLRAKKPR